MLQLIAQLMAAAMLMQLASVKNLGGALTATCSGALT
jgi:hypothetical protein